MANYPQVPSLISFSTKELNDMYGLISKWGNEISFELETRDTLVDSRPSTKVYAVVTVTEIGRPSSGDVAYSKSEGKFKGYVDGSGWVNFN
jgi:hypothetical protein|tara:strand:- start:2609 stop:2881 length:273 start_codon:yes stop_codon:yes gene_type:complete